jgi:hypothetical protein
MTTAKTDTEISALTGESDESVTLVSGLRLNVQRLKTRQLFKLVKIITSGAGGLLGTLDFSGEDASDFAGQLLAITVVAIPEAEDEAIEFIRSMVTPADTVTGKLTKKQIEANDALLVQMFTELENPELDDLISIFEKVFANESDHIQSLGKRLMSILAVRNQGAEAKNS